MEENNQFTFTDNQKDKIYKEMLTELKSRISQISLYDKEAEAEFLEEYNNITENAQELGSSIITKISQLECKILEYEKTVGKNKMIKEQCKLLLQRIEDLQLYENQYSLEEFESSFCSIKYVYNDIMIGVSYEDRDELNKALYSLKAKLIIKKVQNGNINLKDEILPEDEEALKILINNEINALEQSPNLNSKKTANHIKSIMMTAGNDVVYNEQIWKQLDAAQKGISIKEEQVQIHTSEQTALVTIKTKQNIFERLKEYFKKEPQVPLQVNDIHKISIDWLAEQVPVEMLKKMEEQKLGEKAKDVETKYMPNSKLPIYEFLKNTNKVIDECEYDYIDESRNGM